MITLVSSFLSITKTLFASISTAVGVFYWYKYPFFNPAHSKKEIQDTVTYIAYLMPLPLLESTLVGYVLHKYYIVEEQHSILHFCCNCILFSFGIEFVYYIYHRIAHIPFFYSWLHRKHHEKREVFPIDTFFLDPLDFTFLISSMGLPVVFLRLNWYEYITILYLYITFGFISHSKLFYNHHVTHHIFRTCNYCFLVPIMDMLCGTYR